MPQAIGVFVADLFAFNVAGATVAGAAAIELGVTALASVALNQAVGSLLAPKQSSGNGGTAAPQILSTTIRQSDAARRLVYGTVKAGGVLLYPQQDASGQNVRVCIYLGEGPIGGIDPVFWLGDDKSNDPKFDGLLDLETRLGAPGQTAFASLVAASGGEWTNADVGTGCALAMVRMQASREAFPRGRVSLPIAFLINGRLCFDPRTGLTAHTRNAALIRLDHMRCEFGPNGRIPDDQIDFPSFAAAANVCDEIIDSIDPANVVNGVPGKVRRYTVDAVFEVSAGHTEIAETIDRAMAGRVVFVGGKYRCYPGAYRAPTGPELTAQYLRGPVAFRTHQIRTQRINIARGKYREPLQDWQSTDFHEQSLPAAIVAEDGEIVQTLEFPVTTQGAIAQRLAKIAMMQSRSAVPLTLQCNWAALQWQLYDVVRVNIPQIGAPTSMLITGYSITEAGGIDLTLIPHLASDYAWNPLVDEKIVHPVVAPAFNSIAQALQNLTAARVVIQSGDSPIYGLAANWGATNDAYFQSYEVQHQVSGSGAWVGELVTTNSWQSQVAIGFDYDVRARIVRRDGTAGPWVTQTNIFVDGDTTPPDIPMALSVTTLAAGSHRIFWTNPINPDVVRGRVHVNTAFDPLTATAVSGDVYGLPATSYQKDHAPGGPRHYWVSVIDRSGNSSPLEYAGAGT